VPTDELLWANAQGSAADTRRAVNARSFFILGSLDSWFVLPRVILGAARETCQVAVKSPPFQPFSIAGLSITGGVCLLLMAGCGMVAAPQPPSLKLPTPVADLTGQRVGNKVELRWTMPKRATDKELLAGKQKAEVCRRAGTEPCARVGKLELAPEAPASFVDTLAAALASGAPRPLVYTVELENSSGRSAGPSNEAVTSAGAAPPRITNLSAHAAADGIVLSWTATGGNGTMRIHRERVQEKSAGKSPEKAKVPMEQTLEVTGRDEGRVLDHDAALDHIYTYTVQRIEKVTLGGHAVEVASAPSEALTINARDLFPPATPSGLQAVADPEAHAIDLSWQPDTEADVAGYRIYRREASANGVPVRVGAVEAAPAYRDTSALPGRTYEYSVSAVDRDGNESARSAEVEEGLPAQ
jgi:hypothetical protein